MAKGITVKNDRITDVNQQRIETLVRQFEVACHELDTGFYPHIFVDFLPEPSHPLRLPVLTRLIMSDMQRRGKLDASINLDVYVEHFEELRHDMENMPKLMQTELELRCDSGEDVLMGGFRKRFPEHFAAFRSSCQSQESTLRVPAPKTTVGGNTDTIAFHGRPAEKSVPQKGKVRIEENQTDDSNQGSQIFVPDFNAYKLIRPIGEGQFGKVWLAVAPGGVDVAVKIVSWPRAHHMTQMELRALEAVKRIRHPFLIQMHAYWAMEDQLVMVMELADGNLEERHKECIDAGEIGIPVDELIQYTSEAAEALDHLHCEDVVHRDIKPANILLVKGHAKLGDFGVARLVELGKPDFKATVVGTPQFMAAEVFDHQVEPASDQYSLAVMYLDLRVGLPNMSFSDLMSGKGTLLESLVKLPEAERKELEKALDQDPNQRFADCRLMAEALKGATVAQVPPKPARWGLWLTAAVVLIAGAFTFYNAGNNAGNRSANPPTQNPILAPPQQPLYVKKFLAGFHEATDSKLKSVYNIKYPNRLIRDCDGLPLEFVLLPPGGRPIACYIMVDKVSIEAFTRFAKSSDGDPIGDDWIQKNTYEDSSFAEASDYTRLPVMNVTIDEAHSFAEWVHSDARLPTEQEWKKAAGYYDCHGENQKENRSHDLCADYPEGPFRGRWEDGPDISVGRLRPRAVGTSEDDVSLFGCRDMAGNGYEFTISNSDDLPIVKEPEYASFHLLGMGWDKNTPYKYDNNLPDFQYLDHDDDYDNPEQKPNRDRDTGFRIVIPIPHESESSPTT
jgi:serine/threonine protein kinase